MLENWRETELPPGESASAWMPVTLMGFYFYGGRRKPCQQLPLWRNRLARSAVNRKVGGSNPPRGVNLLIPNVVPFRGNTLLKIA